MINWGEWRPDVQGPNSGFAQIADSVLPQAAGSGVGYGPFQALIAAAGATALSGPPKGSISLVKSGGSHSVFFGTASTIEELSSSFGFSVIDSGLSLTAGDDWSFCHFGSYLLNTNTTDGFQAYNVETPAGNNAVSGAPTARFIFSCNNVVVALDCNGNNRRMQTSGVGRYDLWNSEGADGKTFEDGGALVCGADLKNGVAILFQNDAMRIMQFGGAPGGALYTVNKLAAGRGSVGARSVISFDGLVFYLASDGFYRFDLSGGNIPIGAEKVNRWFLDQTASISLSDVQADIDPENKIVCWRFPTTTGQTVFEQMICYDWQLQVWFTVTANTSALARIATPGYTLEDMDAFGTLDGMTQVPLDDRFWQGGRLIFAALDADYKVSTFSGTPMAAQLRSSEMDSPVSDKISWVTPISDAATSTLKVGARDSLSDSVTWGNANTKTRNGAVEARSRGMSITFQEDIPAGIDWNFANGVDHINDAKGGRK